MDEGIHVARQAPHVDGYDGPGLRPDRCRHGPGVERYGLVNVDDNRDRAGRDHGDRRRHVGAGGHEDFIARTHAQPGQRRRQSGRPAGRHADVLHAEELRVAPFEALALASFVIAEQLSAQQNFGYRVDFLLTNPVHVRPLARD